MDQSTDRVPPHSQEAEVAVLGAALLEQGVVPELAEVLEPGHFYRADHQAVFAAMMSLWRDGELGSGPCDVVMVREALRRVGADDIAANPDLFVSLSSAVPSLERRLLRQGGSGEVAAAGGDSDCERDDGDSVSGRSSCGGAGGGRLS